MKYLFAILFIIIGPQAHADPRVDAMVNACRAVHGKDICRLDHQTSLAQNTFVPGMGVIPAKSLQKLIDARDNMCDVIEQMCNQWDSDDCKAVRISWRH